MNGIDAELASRVEHFKDQGYTIFRGVYDTQQVSELFALYERLKADIYDTQSKDSYLIDHLIEREPRTALPIYANPLILDFAEKVMGPFVQISDSVYVGFTPTSKEEAGHKVNGWHRDRYAQVPRGGYQSPVALTVLSYLQDMTETTGPLRIIPATHRTGLLMPDQEKSIPHQDELIVPLKAGDVIAFHSALLHSGSPNRSGKERIFFGGQYNCTWMRHKDNHNGPNVARLVEQARKRNDHRMMRLFGVDEQLEKRINSGFTASDDIRWAEWAAEDKAAVQA